MTSSSILSQVYAIEFTGDLKPGKINTKNASRQVTYENRVEMHCQTSQKLYTEQQIITESTLSFDAQRKAERVVNEQIESNRVNKIRRYIINTRGTCYVFPALSLILVALKRYYPF